MNSDFTQIRLRFAEDLRKVDAMSVTCVEDLLTRMLALQKVLTRTLSLTIRAAEDAEIRNYLEKRKGANDDG